MVGTLPVDARRDVNDPLLPRGDDPQAGLPVWLHDGGLDPSEGPLVRREAESMSGEVAHDLDRQGLQDEDHQGHRRGHASTADPGEPGLDKSDGLEPDSRGEQQAHPASAFPERQADSAQVSPGCLAAEEPRAVLLVVQLNSVWPEGEAVHQDPHHEPVHLAAATAQRQA